jgi:hypothetical protein
MSEVLYGYRGNRISRAELERQGTWQRLHPWMRARLWGLFIASGGRVGLGQGWRSFAEAESEFYERYRPGPGREQRTYKGQVWHLVSGYPVAVPGDSFHNEQLDGFALAADLVGDLDWLQVHAAEHGLYTFRDVNKEPHHVQPIGLPHAVRDWRRQGSPDPFPRAAPVAEHHDDEGDEMLYVINDGTGAIWVGNGITRRHVGNETEYGALRWGTAANGKPLRDFRTGAINPELGAVTVGDEWSVAALGQPV